MRDKNKLELGKESKDYQRIPGPTKQKKRRTCAIVVLFLIVLGFPLISLASQMLSLGVSAFFSYWSYFAFGLLSVLAIFSMYVMLQEQSYEHGEKASSVISNSSRLLVKYKHLTIPSLALSILSLLTWLSGAFNPYFSLELIYTLVIILGLETLFHLLWPPKLSYKLESAILGVLIFVGGLLSLFVIGAASTLVISLVFVGIVFVGGIGSVTMIDLVGSEVSQYLKPAKPLHFLYVFGFFVLLLALVTLNENYLFSLHTLDRVLAGELATLQSGPIYSSLSIEVALVLGAIYLAYSFAKRKHWQNASTLVYILVVIAVSGFFLSFMTALTDTDWSVAIAPSKSLFANMLEILPSISLFVVGYSQLLIELPRKAATKLSLEQDKFLASLTLFVLFSAVAEFSSWSLFGKPGYFLAETDIIQWFAIPLGAIVIAISKVKRHRAQIVGA
ncbi:MAG: hypothetical protein ACYCQJ_02555 [Nitrososphaerales archaeon]